MNIRSNISLFVLMVVCTMQASAQELDKSSYKYESDTIIIRKGIDPKLYAASLEAAKPKVKVMKHVPFAVDTVYFGDKVDYITNYTAKYLRSHQRTISTVNQRSKKVFPLIDGVMAQHKLPKELKYLAVIESALNNNALSKVGARGPWQFMDFTGREMGLVVNGRRDDRTDWNRSTRAAARYLTRLYEDLDDWLLVVAAYNCGPRPVLRAIKRTGSTNFWDIKPYLPRETQGHVLAFVATATIFEKLDYYIGKQLPDEISFVKPTKIEPPKPPKSKFSKEELQQMAIVRISSPIYLELLSNELEIDLGTLYRWNFDYELYEYSTYNSDTYSLRIPKDKLDGFLAKKNFLDKKSKEIYQSQSI